jgi:hypothetical protein
MDLMNELLMIIDKQADMEIKRHLESEYIQQM